MAKKVFISYRRDDTAPAAGRIYDRFCLLLGKRNVFLDVGTIDAGENYETKIEAEIERSDAILVLIGKKWLDAGPAGDRPRLLDERDSVRSEIRAGLERQRLMIPVLIDGAPMPGPEVLPDDIREISKRNALPVRHETFDADVDTVARKALRLAAGERLGDKATLGQTLRGTIAGVIIAAAVLIAIALAHAAVWKRPLQSSIGEFQTVILIAAILASGLVIGLLRGSRRRLH